MSPPPPNQNLSRGACRVWIRPQAWRIILLILLLAILPGCAHQRDPQSAFDRARKTLAHGDLAAATYEAERGYKEFHNISPEWAWKFTIVRASALYQQGMYDKALKLMASEPAVPPSGELAVKKQWLQGL